jgi:hypothetical protein
MEKEEVLEVTSAYVCQDTTFPDYAFRVGTTRDSENMPEHEQEEGVKLLADCNAGDSLEVKTDHRSARVKCR